MQAAVSGYDRRSLTLLNAIVETFTKVGAASGRLPQVRELATCLRAFAPDEIDIGVQYLSGETRQGRFGLGYATLSGSASGPASTEPTLTLAEVDRRLGEIAVIRGAGATARRAAALGELFSSSTPPEREFLIRLLVGALPQ